MTTFDDLPDEILLMSFDLLPKKPLTLTCRRWYELASAQLHLNIDLREQGVMELPFSRSYQRVTIKGIMLHRKQDAEIDPLAKLKKSLQLIRLCEPKLADLKLVIDPEVCHALLRFLPRVGLSRLKRLKICFRKSFLTDAPEDWAVRHMENWLAEPDDQIVPMPNLQKIVFKDCYNEIGEVQQPVDCNAVLNFFSILVQKAKWIKDISVQCTPCPCTADFQPLQSFAQHLTRVDLHVRPIFITDFFNVTFPMLRYLALNCLFCTEEPETGNRFFERHSWLCEVKIYHAKSIQFYKDGVFKCIHLERLFIYENDDISMEGIEKLVNLKQLGFGFAGPHTDIPKLIKLESLVLDKWDAIYDDFYTTISTIFPNLTELVINDVLFNNDCLLAICQTMPQLRRLTIAIEYQDDPDLLTSAGFNSIGRLCKLEYFCFKIGQMVWEEESVVDFFETDWMLELLAREVHLKGFAEHDTTQLAQIFLRNHNIKRLVIDDCGTIAEFIPATLHYS